MKNKSIIAGVLTIALLLPAVAMAAGNVAVSITSAKQEIITKDGKKYARIVKATKFVPGDTIVYLINYTNKGKEPATNAVIDDPIPKGTIYIHNSATGAGADISYSIDGGRTYKKPTLLFYEVEQGGKKEQRVAFPDQYTHIRWTIPSIVPGASGKVGFKVRVK